MYKEPNIGVLVHDDLIKSKYFAFNRFMVIILSGILLMSCIDKGEEKNKDIEKWARLNELIDKEEVSSVIKAYALSMDTRNWKLHRRIFTENYQLYKKGKYKDEHIGDRIKRLDAFTKKYESTQHLASIYSIELSGDSAFVISSLNARHKGKTNSKGETTKDYLMIGQYHYWLKKQEGEWKIYKMRLINAKDLHD